jgi:hypothetical protein
MANPITSDFDVVVQLSEELLDRYMILQYFSDSTLQKIDQIIAIPDVLQATARFNILIPSLSLHVSRPAGSDTQLRIILPFEGNLRIAQFINPLLVGDFYLTGSVFIDTPLAKTVSANSISLDVDFSALVSMNLQVLLSNTNLSPAVSDGLQQLISTALLPTLKARKPMNILKPQLGIPGGIVDLEVRTKNSVNVADLTCLSLFMMATPTAPGVIPLDFVQFLKNDYSVAISNTIYEALKPLAINQAFNLQLFATFPTKLPSDDSITIRSADLTLQNGYLVFSAALTKAIGAIDADVDVSAEVRLDANLDPIVSNLNVDLPWWVDLVNVLLPWLGTGIYLVIRDVVERLVGEQVDTNTPLANLSIFTGFLQLGDLSGHFPAEVTNFGCDISRNGFVLFGDVKLFTYVGNRRSREIHVFNDKIWLAAMTGNYETYMERYEEYVAKGYNGCYYCLRQLNTG